MGVVILLFGSYIRSFLGIVIFWGRSWVIYFGFLGLGEKLSFKKMVFILIGGDVWIGRCK